MGGGGGGGGGLSWGDIVLIPRCIVPLEKQLAGCTATHSRGDPESEVC